MATATVTDVSGSMFGTSTVKRITGGDESDRLTAADVVSAISELNHDTVSGLVTQTGSTPTVYLFGGNSDTADKDCYLHLDNVIFQLISNTGSDSSGQDLGNGTSKVYFDNQCDVIIGNDTGVIRGGFNGNVTIRAENYSDNYYYYVPIFGRHTLVTSHAYLILGMRGNSRLVIPNINSESILNVVLGGNSVDPYSGGVGLGTATAILDSSADTDIVVFSNAVAFRTGFVSGGLMSDTITISNAVTSLDYFLLNFNDMNPVDRVYTVNDLRISSIIPSDPVLRILYTGSSDEFVLTLRRYHGVREDFEFTNNSGDLVVHIAQDVTFKILNSSGNSVTSDLILETALLTYSFGSQGSAPNGSVTDYGTETIYNDTYEELHTIIENTFLATRRGNQDVRNIEHITVEAFARNLIRYSVFSFGYEIIFQNEVSLDAVAESDIIIQVNDEENLTASSLDDVSTEASTFDDIFDMTYKYSLENHDTNVGDVRAGHFDLGSHDLSLERELEFDEEVSGIGDTLSGTLTNINSGIKEVTRLTLGDDSLLETLTNLTTSEDSDGLITLTADELEETIDSTINSLTGAYSINFASGMGPSASSLLSIQYNVDDVVIVDGNDVRVRSSAVIEPGSIITRIITDGDLTLGNGVRVDGGIADNTGILVRIQHLPLAHDAVAAAWPISQGEDNRSGLVTGAVESDVVTFIILKLVRDTEYNIVADALSYRRSAIFTLDTTSQTTIGIGLTRISDSAGNDLIPITLTGDEQDQSDLISYETDTENIVFSTRPPTYPIAGTNEEDSGTYDGSSIYSDGRAFGISIDEEVMYILFESTTDTTILIVDRHEHDSLPSLTDHEGGHLDFDTVANDHPVDCELSENGARLWVIMDSSNVYHYDSVASQDDSNYGVRFSEPVIIADSEGGIAWPVSSGVTDLAMESEISAFIKAESKVYRVLINQDDHFSWSYDPGWGVLTVSEGSHLAYDGDGELLVIDSDGSVSRYRKSDHSLHAVGFEVETPSDGGVIGGISTFENDLVIAYCRPTDDGLVPIKATYHKNSDDAITDFDFRAVAHVIEVGQSSEDALSTPYVAVFSPGSIQFEAGSSRVLQANPEGDDRFIPDLSSFQIIRIGSEHLWEYVDYTSGPIIIDDGAPVNITLKDDEQSIIKYIRDEIDDSGYGLSSIKTRINDVPDVDEIIEGIVEADISGNNDSDARTLSQILDDIENDIHELPSSSDIANEVLSADAYTESDETKTLPEMITDISNDLETVRSSIDGRPSASEIAQAVITADTGIDQNNVRTIPNMISGIQTDLDDVNTIISSLGVDPADSSAATIVDELSTIKSVVESLPDVSSIVEGVFDYDLDSMSNGLQTVAERLGVIAQSVSNIQDSLSDLNIDVDFPSADEIVTAIIGATIGTDNQTVEQVLLELQDGSSLTSAEIAQEVRTVLGTSENVTVGTLLRAIKSVVDDLSGAEISNNVLSGEIESSINVKSALRILLAVLAGSSEVNTDGDDPIVSFKRLNEDEDVIVQSTVTGDGERTSSVV